MPDELGFAAPASRRDLTTLRTALAAVGAGSSVTATFRTAEHGRFTVSGRVRRDLTDTVLKVGWWDLSTGKGTEPVVELQSLTIVGETDDARDEAVETELRSVTSSLETGDVVTADFDFEGCGVFTVAGAIRRDASGSKWILAGHHLAYGELPALRLRRLVIDRRAAVPEAEAGRYDLFGADPAA